MRRSINTIVLFPAFLIAKLSFAQSAIGISPELLRLSKALQFETVSTYDLSSFDPVPYKNFIACLRENFPMVHQKLELTIINNYSLVYFWKGSESSLLPGLFLAHYDVGPVEDRSLIKWEQPPFTGHIDDQFVWGRGAIDDKSRMMAILESAERLLVENYLPRQTIYLAFGHDEEIGGEQGAAKVAEYFHQKKLQFEFIIDEGGGMAQEIFPKMKKTIALVGMAEKGDLNIELSVEDKGGHSATPPGETAIDILAKAITKINKHPMPARLQYPTDEMLSILAPHIDFKTKFAIRNKWLFRRKILKEISKNPGMNALVRTVMSSTIIYGGVKENALPTSATANINVRILQGDSIESVIEHIRKTINDDLVMVTAKKPYHNASPITPPTSRVWDVLNKTINEIYTGVVVVPFLTPGTTDSRHFAAPGTNIFRFMPFTITPENKDQLHGINERISIKEYRQAIRFFTGLIKNIDKEQ